MSSLYGTAYDGENETCENVEQYNSEQFGSWFDEAMANHFDVVCIVCTITH
jgi:hypothetical protein